MFRPNSLKDRLDYGEILIPPAGYHIEKAIGTTYSLDLETLVAVSVSLGLLEDTDSKLVNNPISMLSALSKISDKIIIFCEAGQIKLPKNTNPLCLILEKMILPVKLPYNEKAKKYPAFHPKMWLIQYANGNNLLYRFIVLSRNLTFDHSWDIACSLDGEEGKSNEKTKAIIVFLEFLQKQLDTDSMYYKNHNQDIKTMIKKIANVEFDIDDQFINFDILPLGIGENGYNMSKDPLLNESFNDLVVISPFLSSSIIENFNDSARNKNAIYSLITRKQELSKLCKDQVSDFDVYVMKDEIVDGENTISDGENGILDDDLYDNKEYKKQDIHAKLYLCSKNKSVDLYLGSMNATYSAINYNVEMMIKLHTSTSRLDVNSFMREITNDDSEKNPFELIEIEDFKNSENNSIQDLAEQILKKICRQRMIAKVIKNNDFYSTIISVELDKEIGTSDIYIRPIRYIHEQNISDCITFDSMNILQLSEFYVIKIIIDDFVLERVITIPTLGIPEQRNSEIMKSVIQDKKSFIEYISFILGDDYILSFLENKNINKDYGKWQNKNIMPALYEKMLKTSVHNPEKIEDIKYVLDEINEESIIPDDFREMYKVFCKTLGIK